MKEKNTISYGLYLSVFFILGVCVAKINDTSYILLKASNKLLEIMSIDTIRIIFMIITFFSITIMTLGFIVIMNNYKNEKISDLEYKYLIRNWNKGTAFIIVLLILMFLLQSYMEDSLRMNYIVEVIDNMIWGIVSIIGIIIIITYYIWGNNYNNKINENVSIEIKKTNNKKKQYIWNAESSTFEENNSKLFFESEREFNLWLKESKIHNYTCGGVSSTFAGYNWILIGNLTCYVRTEN